MTATQTAHPKAVRGRRVEFTYYRDLAEPGEHAHPGIITRTEPGLSGNLLAVIRLDGRRSSLHIPVDYEGLTYLDEVTDVPALPMGRFTPEAKDLRGEWEGVPGCVISEDGDLILLTTDRKAAERAVSAYLKDAGLDPVFVWVEDLELCWAQFEWQPADADTDWHLTWCAEGDDQAVQLYHLPT